MEKVEGFWGTITSSVDWCETNYQITSYIAEFFNTVSSLAMIIVGLLGVILHYKTVEKRFSVANIMIVAVGLGSIGFHATLKHAM